MAVQELHGQIVHAIVFPELVDGDDVGVVQQGRRPGFPFEARLGLVPEGGAGRNDLQRHIPSQLRIAAQIDLAHGPLANQAHHLEPAQPIPHGTLSAESAGPFSSG